jgi:hypothetical protein
VVAPEAAKFELVLVIEGWEKDDSLWKEGSLSSASELTVCLRAL